MHSWSNEYLRERFGNDEVAVQLPEADGQFHYRSSKQTRFHDFLEEVTCPNPKMQYLTTNALMGAKGEILHALANDFPMPEFVPKESVRVGNIWIGPAGTKSVLHHDAEDNILAMVRGRKKFVLFAPSDTKNVYPYPVKNIRAILEGRVLDSRIDMSNVDFERFPRFRKANPIHVTITPPEMLYLPAGYWHYVVGEEMSIMVNFWFFPLAYRATLLPPVLQTRIKWVLAAFFNRLESYGRASQDIFNRRARRYGDFRRCRSRR